MTDQGYKWPGRVELHYILPTVLPRVIDMCAILKGGIELCTKHNGGIDFWHI